VRGIELYDKEREWACKVDGRRGVFPSPSSVTTLGTPLPVSPSLHSSTQPQPSPQQQQQQQQQQPPPPLSSSAVVLGPATTAFAAAAARTAAAQKAHAAAAATTSNANSHAAHLSHANATATSPVPTLRPSSSDSHKRTRNILAPTTSKAGPPSLVGTLTPDALEQVRAYEKGKGRGE